MLFLTSDQHFGHTKVIEYSDRPFSSVEEMDQVMFDNYQEIVDNEDSVIFVGDFSFLNKTRTRALLEQLRGHKILVRGNHDHSLTTSIKLGFARVYNCLTLFTRYGNINISHYPYRSPHPIYGYEIAHWDKRLSDDGRVLFHGHVHEKWLLKDRMVNVGVDKWNFAPVSLPELLEFIF